MMKTSTKTKMMTRFVVISVRILDTFDSFGGLNPPFAGASFEELLIMLDLLFYSSSFIYPLDSLGPLESTRESLG